MAVYQQLYGEFALWVRPVKMFFEEIEVNGRRRVYVRENGELRCVNDEILSAGGK